MLAPVVSNPRNVGEPAVATHNGPSNNYSANIQAHSMPTLDYQAPTVFDPGNGGMAPGAERNFAHQQLQPSQGMESMPASHASNPFSQQLQTAPTMGIPPTVHIDSSVKRQKQLPPIPRYKPMSRTNFELPPFGASAMWLAYKMKETGQRQFQPAHRENSTSTCPPDHPAQQQLQHTYSTTPRARAPVPSPFLPKAWAEYVDASGIANPAPQAYPKSMTKNSANSTFHPPNGMRSRISSRIDNIAQQELQQAPAIANKPVNQDRIEMGVLCRVRKAC